MRSCETYLNNNNKRYSREHAINVEDGTKYIIILTYALIIWSSSVYFNSVKEIIDGMRRIVIAPGILVSDYIAIGNIGAAIFNCGILMIVCIIIAKINNISMNGSTIAAIFTVGAFALFGKNIYNIWSIFLGTYLYSVARGEKFDKYIFVAFYGTALGPLVSQISFGLEFPIIQGIILGNIAGIVAGFIMPPLSLHFSKFHQGFNLYNMGFTAGITGTLFMAFIRGYGKNNTPASILAEGYNNTFTIYLSIIFVSMIIIGYVFNGMSFKGYNKLLGQSGVAGSDFVKSEGFGLSFINMGFLGFMSTAYVLLVKGQLNGPTIGGIITIVGFGAFGKHVKNVWPIFAGVLLASATQVYGVNAMGSLLAALFGTTLAPIAGRYGWKIGILAGFMHMTLVMNTGVLHGGMNLYNNGFAGGLVAAALVPIVDALLKKESN